MSTELMVELPKQNTLQVFVTDGGIDTYIEKVREEVKTLVPDIATKKGRSDIASMAAKVSKIKTRWDELGKNLCDQERAKIDATLSAVLESRKHLRASLDDLRDEVRKPLTDWENAEAERKARIESRIEAMQRLPEIGSDAIAIQKHIKRLEVTEIDESFEEFTAHAAITRTRAIRECQIRLDAQLKIEQDLKELEELRVKNAAQSQKDREAEIAKQAAYVATQKAERESQAKLDEANALLEKERAAAADEKEKERIEAAKEAARITDESHRKVVINQAIVSIISNGYDKKQAEDIIGLIIEGRIAHVTINF